MTWSTTSQPSFTISGGLYNADIYTFTPGDSTSTYLAYDHSGLNNTALGIVFKPNANGTGIDVYCNDTGPAADTGEPSLIAHAPQGLAHAAVVYNVSPGGQIDMASSTHNYGSFNVPNFTLATTVHRTGTFVPPATIYCTDTSHAQYPSHASGYLFARDTSNDVIVGGVITKYAYILGETSVPQGYANSVIHLDTSTNTWVDGHATNEPDPIEHVPGAYWVRWRHASQSSTTWYYFEDKSSWYSAAGGGSNPLSNNSSSGSSKKVFHNFW